MGWVGGGGEDLIESYNQLPTSKHWFHKDILFVSISYSCHFYCFFYGMVKRIA